MRYLLVTHIAFAEEPDGSILLDRLWAEDLKGLVSSVGPVTIAAPRLASAAEMKSWGPGTISVSPSDGLSFVALPLHKGRFDLFFAGRVRRALAPAVREADLVHTSNLFFPSVPLYYGHDLAARLGKKTLFVVAEDFYDMLNWEWVRTAPSAFSKLRRRRQLRALDRAVRKRVASASLTFLHTPAAVTRYREFAQNAVAIRQPVHELVDVIAESDLAARLSQVESGTPLQLVAACRMQQLKGVDFMLRAVALLRSRGVPVFLTLYGQGEQKDAFIALAERLQISDAVRFAGSVSPGPELRAALSKAHIFLMPHLTTDFGRAFFDAMAAALPVIAFRSPASQDTVRHGVDGLITPMADVEGLAAGIARYHTDRALLAQASSAARERGLLNTKSTWNQLRAQMIRELF